MLHRKASVSRDLADLRAKLGADAALFYVLMIPHLDRWGCIADDPVTLRALVVPMWDDVSPSDVKRWTAWMVKRGMLERVTGGAGDKGLRAPEFHDHQRGTEFQKESPSPYEPASITKKWVRDSRKPKVADLQDGRRPVGDQSPTWSVRREGKGTSNPSPSPSPPPVPPGQTAAESEPEPGAQPRPLVEVNTNGNGRAKRDEPVGVDELLGAVTNPALRSALQSRRSS